jgi:hypothetical protein
MKEIIELNQRLCRELGKQFEKEELFLRRNDQPDELKRLPARWQEEIQSLRNKINQVVPNDFTYTLWLGKNPPMFSIGFGDGAQTEMFGGPEWRRDMLLVEQLKEIDWDGSRGVAMANCQIFDRIAANAKDAPALLPSTEQVQAMFHNTLHDFLRSKRSKKSKIRALLWREDDGLTEEGYEDMKAFQRALPDIMTVHYLVVTVVENGKPFSVGEIEQLKKAAVDELKDMPISHAQAQWKL